jgi:hypothetical protein
VKLLHVLARQILWAAGHIPDEPEA